MRVGLFRGALTLFLWGSAQVTALLAQQLATLNVSVTDQSAAAIPQARVPRPERKEAVENDAGPLITSQSVRKLVRD
jgi:hypothetical protein